MNGFQFPADKVTHGAVDRCYLEKKLQMPKYLSIQGEKEITISSIY